MMILTECPYCDHKFGGNGFVHTCICSSNHIFEVKIYKNFAAPPYVEWHFNKTNSYFMILSDVTITVSLSASLKRIYLPDQKITTAAEFKALIQTFESSLVFL